MSAEGGTKAVVAALLANMGIAVTKFIAWGLTMSSSMLAESIHSVADASNQALLLIGGKRSRRSATPRHPFGYGRERYIYAFIVSIVLFSVGGLFALYEAYHKFQHPEPITSWHWVPVVVLLVAIVLESFSFRTAILESRKVKGDASWAGFVRHSRVPELPVVLLEDLAALLGLVFALIGVSMTLITDNGIWDAVGTTAIGLLLVVVAIVLAIETKSLLLGESATKKNQSRIEAAILSGGEVERIIHMRTLHIGPEELLVAVKVGIPGDVDAARIAASINTLEARIRDAVPIARIIYIEPDIYAATAAS
ncbi:MAG: cation diffusion facilitator family transporter [Longispora sp.]|nr:cation diffusion facilitator family transporter [Longispora sp. (in: high G+C Gram-positive bacteria)]